MGLREWTRCVQAHKNKLTLSKTYFFVIEKHVEDVKQDEKHVPDLVESIMEGFGLVKEELQLISFKSNQFRPKISKIRVCTFQTSGKIPDSSKTSPRAPFLAIFGRASSQIFPKI